MKLERKSGYRKESERVRELEKQRKKLKLSTSAHLNRSEKSRSRSMKLSRRLKPFPQDRLDSHDNGFLQIVSKKMTYIKKKLTGKYRNERVMKELNSLETVLQMEMRQIESNKIREFLLKVNFHSINMISICIY